MSKSIVKLFASGAIVGLLYCSLASPAEASVFRERAAFNAAAQNLNTIDFESAPPNQPVLEIDGVAFANIGGTPGIMLGQGGNKLLFGSTVGEFTMMTVYLPPGTTAVGCDQFNAPMIVSISNGESVTMNPSDTSTFVGFVSDQPINTLTFFLDFPEPTPSVLAHNLTFGQRRVNNEPPVPQLLETTDTGRSVALTSVTTLSEPFNVLSFPSFATDGHTRITLFLVGVALGPEDLPFVTVQAEDSAQRLFDLPCEATGKVKNLSWMSQVTVRLPDALDGAGNLQVSVSVRGKVSNKAPIRIE